MSKQLNVLINELADIRASITEAGKEVTELKKLRDAKEAQLLAAMDAVGTERAGDSNFTATVTTLVMPQIENWDKFYTYIHRNKAYYLLERRTAAVAFRETLNSRSRSIPGATTFTKRTVSVRKRPS